MNDLDIVAHNAIVARPLHANTVINVLGRVENALNQLDGVWAQVDLSSHQVTVRMKQALSEDTLRDAVRAAGYIVLSIQGD